MPMLRLARNSLMFSLSHVFWLIAGRDGVEPPSAVLETAVLPLNYRPICHRDMQAPVASYSSMKIKFQSSHLTALHVPRIIALCEISLPFTRVSPRHDPLCGAGARFNSFRLPSSPPAATDVGTFKGLPSLCCAVPDAVSG